MKIFREGLEWNKFYRTFPRSWLNSKRFWTGNFKLRSFRLLDSILNSSDAVSKILHHRIYIINSHADEWSLWRPLVLRSIFQFHLYTVNWNQSFWKTNLFLEKNLCKRWKYGESKLKCIHRDHPQVYEISYPASVRVYFSYFHALSTAFPERSFRFFSSIFRRFPFQKECSWFSIWCLSIFSYNF